MRMLCRKTAKQTCGCRTEAMNKTKNILNSLLATVIHKNKRNAASNSEKVVHHCSNVYVISDGIFLLIKISLESLEFRLKCTPNYSSSWQNAFSPSASDIFMKRIVRNEKFCFISSRKFVSSAWVLQFSCTCLLENTYPTHKRCWRK